MNDSLAKKSSRAGLLASFLILVAAVSAADFHLKCETDSDCASALTTDYRCVSSVCKNESVTTLSLKSVVGIGLIISVSSIANAGGIGGGAILSAVYILVFHFSIGDSIPLSHATIFSGALMNFFVIAGKRTGDDRSQLLVNYRLVSAIAPLMLGGAMAGVLLNKLLPPIVVLTVLVVYLINRTYYFYFDTRMIQEKEQLEKELEQQQQKTLVRKDSQKIAREKFLEMTSMSSPRTFEGRDQRFAALNQSAPDELLLRHLESDEKSTWTLLRQYKPYLWLCAASCGIVLVTILLRGGKGFGSVIGIASCSAFSWVILVVSELALLVLSTVSTNLQIRDRTIDLMALSNPFQAPNLPNAQGFILDSFKAGVISGSLGLGGGLVLIPLLIGRSFAPEVASAISGFIVLLSSFCTTTQFLILGAFDVRTTLVIIASSGLGSFCGSKLIHFFIQRYERPSILMWVVFAILLVSALVLPVVGILNLFGNSNSLKFSVP